MSVLYRNVSYGFVGLKEKKEQKKKRPIFSWHSVLDSFDKKKTNKEVRP